MELRIVIHIEMKIVSELNVKEHWAKRHRRHKTQNLKIWQAMRTINPQLPCKVNLIRVAPRALDYDNLVGAMKSIRDCVADQLIPGLAPGRADNFAGLSWEYAQKKDKPKYYGLSIEFFW
jgi:hypothetical protein